MALLSDMRAYLQKLQAGDTTFLAERSTIDRAPLRKLILAAVAEDDAREPAPRMHWQLRDRLLEHGDVLIFEILQQVADLPGLSTPEDLSVMASAALVEVLCDHYSMARVDGMGSESLGRLRATLIDRVCDDAWTRFAERCEQCVPSPRLYALELGLVQVVGARPKVAPLGEVFLRLGGVDATRWPIAVELLTAIDRDDPWRGGPSLAAHLLKHSTLLAYAHESQYGMSWPWSNPALARWTDLGLLKHEVWQYKERADEPDGGESYTLTDLGSRILTELTRDPDSPIKSFARALLEDASDVMLDVVPSRHGGAAASVVRHTRMLAHEMRNALVPVRFAYDQLWSRLPRDEVRVALHRQHTKVIEGLDRALRFVTDAARAVGSLGEEPALFLVASALEEACTTVTTSTSVLVAVTIDPDASDTRLVGARPRLVLALVNILRNSVQNGGPAVRVSASLTRAAGYVAVLTLEDSGPGIPEARRDRLFENGHSTQKHGTGHGLSLVREVVEQDFSGSVHYEPSALGGARFVLRFPIPNEAT